VLIGGFSDARIARFRRITQGRVATSAGPAASLAMWAAARVGRTIHRPVAAYQVPAEYRALPLDRKYVTAIQAAGAQVHVWTVNEPEEMHRILDLGADGIVTDRPDLLNDVMRARGHDV
ncbi:MAG: glycerophosphodiester phosphodiesterase family protein, partial [Acidimicrobiia bacterium]|jgi:glycerophosphoryl diester phosphodiesterase